jgi:outer membrane protein assembly factor BamA
MVGASLLLLLTFAGAFPAAQQQEVIAEVRIHGNHISTDDEILKISGITIGAPFTATTIAEVTKRLRDAKRFDDVDVLKRFASIEDPSKISVVIIVNEGPVRIDIPELPDDPLKVVKRRGFRNLMWMPILDGEDGYGFTYGVRIARPGVWGEKGRLSFPLTWGGLRRAGVEYDRPLERGPFTRIEVGTAIQRRENPAFAIGDVRFRTWGRAERSWSFLRTGVTGGWQKVSFADLDDTLRTIGADIALDTRVDPVLPRNDIFATLAVEKIFFGSDGVSSGDVTKIRFDGRGYVGLFRQNVLVLRIVREDADRSLPPYLLSLLGGWSSLRGFEAGQFVGDTMVHGSLEVRIPLSTPLSVGKVGVSVFVDSGKAYPKTARFEDAPLHTGVGGSGWLTIGPFKMSLSVARGLGSGIRVNFGGGLTF